MKQCKECGTFCSDESIFCTVCGRKLPKEADELQADDIKIKRQRDEKREKITKEINVLNKQIISLKIKKRVLVYSGIGILTMLFALFEILARYNGAIVPDTIKIMSKQMPVHILIHVGVYVVMLLAFKFALEESIPGVVIFCVIATLGGAVDIATSFDAFKEDIIVLCLTAGVILFNVFFLIVYYKKYGKTCFELLEAENRLQTLTRDLKIIG